MSEQEILAVLDGLSESIEFPGFNNANYESADARMHLFRDGEGGWAVLIEEAVDWPGGDGASTILFGAGPLLAEGGGGLLELQSWLVAVTDDEGELESAELRGEEVDVTAMGERAAALDVSPAFALLLHLSETSRAALFHTVDELAEHVAPGALHVLTIEEWCHPNVYHGDLPSASEAFQQVAAVLARGDASAWAPSEAPNTRDWKMWQGTM